MKGKNTKNSLLAILTVLMFVVALPVVVSAQPTGIDEARTAVQEKKEMMQEAAANKKQEVQTRLAEAKLKACQKREKVIANIMTRIADRGQKQIDLFGKIADRTQAFYVNKGKTLNNYDALVEDIATQRDSAQQAVDATKATIIEFKCDGTDPKGAAASFKEQLESQNTALKAYKIAVKNLIVGVKSIQGTATAVENSTGDGQ